MMVFTLALAHISPMVPNKIPIHAVVRLVWDLCSVTADPQLRTGAYGPITLDNATVPVAELPAVIFLVEWSVGPIHIHSDCKYVCSGKNKLAQRRERDAHVTLSTRLQQALSRHQGTVEISWCKAHVTSDTFHQFAMTPEILVGSAVADALAKKGASDITWAVQQRIYATSMPRSASAHPEDVLLPSPKTGTHHPGRTLHRTHWFLLAKGIIAMCAKTLHQRVVRWDWLRNTICSGPPSSHPSVPVRVGHQMLHESHRLRFNTGVYWCTTRGQIAQHAAGKKSRAIGLVNECPGYLTCAGRDVLARIERGLSPKASADWPLMRDTVSINNG